MTNKWFIIRKHAEALRDELTGRYGVWKTSCNPDELIGKHVAYIGTHGLRLDDNNIIQPYIESINIRDALGLGD